MIFDIFLDNPSSPEKYRPLVNLLRLLRLTSSPSFLNLVVWVLLNLCAGYIMRWSGSLDNMTSISDKMKAGPPLTPPPTTFNYPDKKCIPENWFLGIKIIIHLLRHGPKSEQCHNV